MGENPCNWWNCHGDASLITIRYILRTFHQKKNNVALHVVCCDEIMLADVACSDDMWKPTRWKFDWEKMLTRFSIPWSFICRSLDRILGKPHWSPTIAFHSGQNLTLGFRVGRKDDYPAAGFLVVFRWRTNYYLHGQPLQWFLWAFDILVKRQNATILGTFDPANPPQPKYHLSLGTFLWWS